jgi:intracellular septation protein A
MSVSMWMRQGHRWISIFFTLTVVVNFAVRVKGEPPHWVTYSPLLPLFLLLFSGLYLFVLPYSTQWRRTRRSGAVE